MKSCSSKWAFEHFPFHIATHTCWPLWDSATSPQWILCLLIRTNTDNKRVTESYNEKNAKWWSHSYECWMASTKLLMSSYIFGFTSGNLEGCFQGKTMSQPLKVFMLQTNFSINLCTAVSWKNIYPPHISPTYEFPVEGQSLLKWSPPVCVIFMEWHWQV